MWETNEILVQSQGWGWVRAGWGQCGKFGDCWEKYLLSTTSTALERFWGHLKTENNSFAGRRVSPARDLSSRKGCTRFGRWNSVLSVSRASVNSQGSENSQVSIGPKEARMSQGPTAQGLKSKQTTHTAPCPCLHGQRPPGRRGTWWPWTPYQHYLCPTLHRPQDLVIHT